MELRFKASPGGKKKLGPLGFKRPRVKVRAAPNWGFWVGTKPFPFPLGRGIPGGFPNPISRNPGLTGLWQVSFGKFWGPNPHPKGLKKTFLGSPGGLLGPHLEGTPGAPGAVVLKTQGRFGEQGLWEKICGPGRVWALPPPKGGLKGDPFPKFPPFRHSKLGKTPSGLTGPLGTPPVIGVFLLSPNREGPRGGPSGLTLAWCSILNLFPNGSLRGALGLIGAPGGAQGGYLLLGETGSPLGVPPLFPGGNLGIPGLFQRGVPLEVFLKGVFFLGPGP